MTTVLNPIPVEHDDGVVVGVGGQHAVADDAVVVLEDGGDDDADGAAGRRLPHLLEDDVCHGLCDAGGDHRVGGDVAHVEEQHGGGAVLLRRGDDVCRGRADDVFVPASVCGNN